MKTTVLILLGCLLMSPALAYRIDWGRNVTISRPVYEDLYIAGGTVIINAPVYGDVIIAGGKIAINDTIKNDLLLAGGNVTINGYIADDVRCAGGEMHVQKNIGGDLVIAGGTVLIDKGVIIAGGLIASGGDIVTDATVNGAIKAAGASFIFNGEAETSLDCRAEHIVMNGIVKGPSILAAKEIVVQEGASFNGGIRYWNRQGRQDWKQSVKNGIIVYDPSLKIKTNNWYYLGHATVIGLVWYLVTVLSLVLLIQFLFSNTFKKAGHTAGVSLLKSLGSGFLFLIGIPIAVALLLITIIGIPIGLILMAFYVAILLLATIITSLVFANWYNDRFGYQWGYWKIVLSAMGMFILFKLVSFTPFFGWLLMIVVVCVAFGALFRNINWTPSHKIAAPSP